MDGTDHNEHAEYLPSTSRPAPGDEFDALADLFLGDTPLAPAGAGQAPPPRSTGTDPAPVRAPTPRVEAAKPPRIEAVVLGHLPVRASIWVRQYAGSVADAMQSPVALLRVSPESTSLELVGAGVRAPAETFESLRDAIADARRSSAHWIVRVEETDEPSLIARDDLDEITVLTGADEAAVVASYRLMKSLSSDWDKRLDEDEGPGLRLAIMGAGSDEALVAGEKLERAARAFLQRPVQVSARVPRIGAVGSAVLFRGETGDDLESLLGAITNSTPAQDATPRLRLASDDAVERQRPAARTSAPVEPKPEIVVPATRHAHPKPAQAPAADARHTPMSSLLPGLTLLETRCPKAGRVELATDEDGRLHLIARSGADPTQPVDSLVATSAWAREHLALLLRAEPTLAAPSADPESDSTPVLHLVTTEPKLIRPLLDADVRVHLLTEVEVAGQTARVTTELN